MAEQKGIKVTYPATQESPGATAEFSQVYPDATTSRVGTLGHLFVDDDTGRGTVAVYAPGQWLRAEVEQGQKTAA